MGIASFLLGENNPFAQWAGQNQNTLSAIGAGLAQGQNLQGGLAAGLAAVPQAKQLDQAAAEKLKAEKLAENQANATKNWLSANHPDLAQMVDAGMPVSEAWQAAMKRMEPGAASKPLEVNGQLIDPNTYEVLGDYRTVEGKGGNAEVALQPTWLQDAQGNWVLGQLSKDGSVVQTKLPDGMRPADPGLVAGTKTGATVDAKTTAAARAALPGMETSVSIAKKAFDLVRSDTEGRKQWFGQAGAFPRGMWVQGGSPMANFQTNASQTLGQAFAQARETLKGGGPITDYEGKAAAQAYSRAEMALKQGDEQAFLAAVDDMEAAIMAGYQKLVDTAQGDPTGGAMGRAAPPAALSSGNVTSTGVPWSIEP